MKKSFASVVIALALVFTSCNSSVPTTEAPAVDTTVVKTVDTAAVITPTAVTKDSTVK